MNFILYQWVQNSKIPKPLASVFFAYIILHQNSDIAELHRYTEILELVPDKNSRCKIYCNRSLAYVRALRHSEALQDAEAAIECNPSWCKAHWRRGAALKELKRMPHAVAAFLRAWQLSRGSRFLVIVEIIKAYSVTVGDKSLLGCSQAVRARESVTGCYGL